MKLIIDYKFGMYAETVLREDRDNQKAYIPYSIDEVISLVASGTHTLTDSAMQKAFSEIKRSK